MYSIHRHNILTIKEGRVSRDVVGANVYTSIDTGNTKRLLQLVNTMISIQLHLVIGQSMNVRIDLH